MRRRTRLVLAVALTATLGAVVAPVAFRAAIVETLLTEVLLARGVPAPRLAVAEIGWRHSRIADIRLGDADEVALREVRLDYGLAGLLAGRLDQVTMTGLAVTLDLTGTGPPLGSLQPLLAGGDRGEGGTIPNVEIAELHLMARTAGGIVQATGGGRLHGAGDTIAAELSLPEIAFGEDTLAAGRLTVDLADGKADANLSVDALAGDFSVAAAVSLEDLLEAPRWRLDLVARAAAESPLWAAWPGPAPSAGRAEITLRGKGNAPPLSEILATGDPLRWLLAHEAGASVTLLAADVTVPEHVDGLGIDARLTLDVRDGAATVTLRDAATLAAARLSPAWLRSLGVPGEFADVDAQGFTARVQATAEEHPVAVVARDGDAFTVALDGTVRLAVPGVADLSLSLPADVRIAPGHLSGQLRAPADVRLTTLRYGEIGELLAPATVAIAEARVAVGLEAADTTLDYRVVLEAPALRVLVNRQDAAAIELAIVPGRIAAAPGRIDIAGAGIEVPAYAIAADGLAAGIDLANGEMGADVRVAALRHTGARPLLAPMALAGTIGGQGILWQWSLTGEGPGGVGRLQVAGEHDSGTGQGSAQLSVPPLGFSPDGVQPGVLVPALAALQRVTGTAEGEAELSWSARGVQGSGAVALRDIGFDSPQARVAGLDLRLRLDSLTPPGSPPRQTLSVRRLEAGLPLDRLAIAFQVQPADPPRLAIETGEVFFGSGRLAVDGLLLDPAAPRQRVDLRVEDISLSELFAILGIDGLSGEGRLSGTIPIHFTGDSVAIEDGHLAAGAPGIVRFRSEQAAQILAGQGESLDLVLRALEDFHYDELTVDLSKTAADVGRMQLSLLGKNPAVLEGYPFRFNIGIEADTGKLVTALTTIYQLPSDFLRRAWTSGR